MPKSPSRQIALLLAAVMALSPIADIANAGTETKPVIGSDGRVTFRLHAPNATKVSVLGVDGVGDMRKDSDGLWSATTGQPLKPDIYTYSFDVDGLWIADPGNKPSDTEWVPSTGGSTLRIPGAPWSTDAVVRGAVARHEYRSNAIDGIVSYYVYTPPAYDPARPKPYPVLVVLPGLGGSGEDWIQSGGTNILLDNLTATQQAVPMIVVSASPAGTTGPIPEYAKAFPHFTEALLTEIMPQVEHAYNASTAAEDHAITGLSAGGAQALLLANEPGAFQWIGSFGPGLDMFDTRWGTGGIGPNIDGQRPLLPDGQLAETFPKVGPRQLKLLYLYCRDSDDHQALTRQFVAFTDNRGIASTFVTEPGGKHNMTFWRPQLALFVSKLFH